MNADTLGKEVYAAIQDASRRSPRSVQAAEFRAGISDLGFCSERTRRFLDQQVPADTDHLSAFIGTAIGDHVEQAALRHWPDALRQIEVQVDLFGDTGSYRLTGHPDLVLPEHGLLIDFKTDYGLTTIRRTGPNQQQQFQRHCYAKGAWLGGFFPMPLEEVQVANVWIDRAAIDKGVHVDMEPYSEEQVIHAGHWLDDVVYAYLHNEEAKKEPPRDMCAVICGFYDVCRAHDTDVEGLLTDPVTLNAVAMYREGIDLEKQGRRLKDEAKQHLVGVKGSTGEFMVRWTHINETVIPETERAAYDKLEVRTMPKRKHD